MMPICSPVGLLDVSQAGFELASGLKTFFVLKLIQ
jgi:hypothetical protein